MTTIYLIRHSIKEKNYGIFDNSDSKQIKDEKRILSCEGEKQALLLAQSEELQNFDEYWNYNTTIQYGTSENIKSFFDRIYNFLDELKSQNYKSVLIVAHSGVSKAFSAYFDGINDGWFLNRGLKNCEIKEYKL